MTRRDQIMRQTDIFEPEVPLDIDDSTQNYCSACNGSGEGSYDRSVCHACKGSGHIPKPRDERDYGD